VSITVDGNNLVFTGTVTVTNFTNPTNGVCTLVLTPSGGVGSLPALAAGTPGLPPTVTLGSVTTLSPGAAATASLTLTGGSGTTTNSSGQLIGNGNQPSYTLALGIPQGAAGATSTFALGNATDVSGTAAKGLVPVVTGTSPTAFTLESLYNNAVYNPSSTFSNVSQSGYASSYPMTSVPIPAGLPFSYVPLVFAGCTAVGTANTVINLTATLGSGGSVIAADYGLASTPTQKLRLAPSFAGVVGVSPFFGRVSTVNGSTPQTTIYINLSQSVSGISDAWTVAASSMFATVVCLPVGP